MRHLNHVLTRAAAALLLALSPLPAAAHKAKHAAKSPFKVASVVYYQPVSVLADRTGDTGLVKAYVKNLEHTLSATLRAGPKAAGFSAAIVVAVKPGDISHAWLVTRGAVPSALASQLTAAAQAVPPVDVQGGPIALAVVFTAYGGGGPAVVDKNHPIPIPPAWHDLPPAQPNTPAGPS